MKVDKQMIIITDNQETNIPDGNIGILSFTYLHGKLEFDAGYDRYGIIGYEEYGFVLQHSQFIAVDSEKTGLYPCVYNNKPCTLFLWVGDIGHYHGLVVYNDDHEYYSDAREKFESKAKFI